jgi:hypothetical protein
LHWHRGNLFHDIFSEARKTSKMHTIHRQ